MPGTMLPAALIERVQNLTDLELAMLLSLMAGQHCVITAEQGELESMEQEVHLVLRVISLLANLNG